MKLANNMFTDIPTDVQVGDPVWNFFWDTIIFVKSADSIYLLIRNDHDAWRSLPPLLLEVFRSTRDRRAIH